MRGKWLKPGTHVDLAGAFKPQMRETDGEVIARARVYVDTREGAEAEAGDLLQAAHEGKFRMESIAGDLFGLCRGETAGRRNSEEITLFQILRHRDRRPRRRDAGLFQELSGFTRCSSSRKI